MLDGRIIALVLVASFACSGCAALIPGATAVGPIHPERPEKGELEVQGQGGVCLGTSGGLGAGAGGAFRLGAGLGRQAEFVSSFHAGGRFGGGAFYANYGLGIRRTMGPVTLSGGLDGGLLIEEFDPDAPPFGWLGPDLGIAFSSFTDKGFFSLSNQLGLGIPFPTPPDLAQEYGQKRPTFSYMLEPAWGTQVKPRQYFTVNLLAGITVVVRDRSDSSYLVFLGVGFGYLGRPQVSSRDPG